MDRTTKFFVGLCAVIAVCMVTLVPSRLRAWKEHDRRFAEAVRNRRPQIGEQGAEMQAAMADARKYAPAPSPAEEQKAQQFMQHMNNAAPGSATAMEVITNPDRVKTQTPEQRMAAIQTMMPMLKSSEPMERAMAADTLGRIGDYRAVPALTLLQSDPDPGVRTEARKALIALGYPVR